ncbi:MAG: right-handed parallel beta-helix repeat-containing protein, partial [Candidatus Cloacimonetes bacterium]|nr:right-handed parallel beta-helix repeat-containing protein [Candidatus Cloacimonadota bacterium]
PNYTGGGIYCANNSSPTITGNTITGNTSLLACGGGIICIYNSSPIITGNTITGNTAGELGGGIECANNSSPIIADNTITLNHARAGGGISCYINSSPTIANNTITGNTVAYAGGGIVSVYGSSPTITDNIITGNAADSLGGGIGFSESSPTITHNTIEGNTAPYGGGIACGSTSSGTIDSCTISGNSAVDEGGGIYCSNSSPRLQNVTITGNSAVYDGGGIYCAYNSNPLLLNSILWNDIPQEVYFHQNGGPNSITISYSDVQGGEAGIVTNNNGTVYWLEGNIDEDPLFVGTGDHPFMLQDLSPCVNAGIPDTTGLNLPEFDLAGNSRVFGGRIDMGAYENQNVIVNADEDLIPLITKLNQNYPNPFNPTTTINYSLKENSKVSINIYNIKGQKVRTLIKDKLEAGNYSVIWYGKDNNGKSVSSGIYFYKLKTDKFEKTKKMILMK